MKQRFETFTVLINKISRNIRKIKNQEMAAYGLRSTHVSCLYFLYCAHSLTATELCERCEEDKATVSRALEFLEERGFTAREPKAARRYKSPVYLTEKGLEAGKRIHDKVGLVLDEVGVGLSDAERDLFYKYLGIISDNLEHITEELS